LGKTHILNQRAQRTNPFRGTKKGSNQNLIWFDLFLKFVFTYSNVL